MYTVYFNYDIEIEPGEIVLSDIELQNRKNQDKEGKYTNLDNNGIVKKYSVVKPGDILVAKIREVKSGDKRERPENHARVQNLEGGIVDRILDISKRQKRLIRIRVRQTRQLNEGSKLIARYAQKGVLRLVPEVDMPFNPITGEKPDVIINPHAIPGRMTVGMLVEMLTSNYAVWTGSTADASIFSKFDYTKLVELLKRKGLAQFGEEQLVDGITGEEFQTLTFTGNVYYMSAPHNAEDKIKVTGYAKNISKKTGQPIGSRKSAQATSISTQDTTAFINWGATAIIRERLNFSSCRVQQGICRKCGNLVWRRDLGEFRCNTCRSQDISLLDMTRSFRRFYNLATGLGLKISFEFST